MQWQAERTFYDKFHGKSDIKFCKSSENDRAETCIVLTGRRQLHWLGILQRLPKKIRPIVKIDATFNCGDTYVTCATIKLPCVTTQRSTELSPEHPLMLVSVMLHTTRSMEAYRKLIEQLETALPHMRDEEGQGGRVLVDATNLPSLVHTQTFGCDEEKALVKAIESHFPKASIVHCTAHIYSNFRDKAMKCAIGEEERNCTWKSIQDAVDEPDDNVFEDLKLRGMNQFQSQVCHSKRVEFGEYLGVVLDKLNEHSRKPHFHSQVPGSPDYDSTYLIPLSWTNNNAESMNSALKRECRHQPQSLEFLVEVLCKRMDRQKIDMSRAIKDEGEWVLEKSIRKVHQLNRAEWNSLSDVS